VTPTYDGNGNLTFDGTFTYGYDAENRLISASGAGNTASYAYDAQGRRKSKIVNGTTTIFAQDPQGRALLDYMTGPAVRFRTGMPSAQVPTTSSTRSTSRVPRAQRISLTSRARSSPRSTQARAR
jgi:YD repeat-containing protein